MKKQFKKTIQKTIKRGCSVLLALTMSMSLMSLAACGGGTGTGNDEEQVDNERTQLYVFNFAGGYDAEWLVAVKERFEELHKDDVYEEGKKGVQIVVNNSKSSADSLMNQIEYNVEEVYFTELAYYYTLKEAGVLGDITEAVTKELSEYGDEAGSTILSKMSEEQKAFYGIEEGGEMHYYGIPHYAGYTSLIYNVDLFEEEKYYFADGVTDAQILEDRFIVKSTDKKSAGPDGVYGTDDDGLPATFDEFFMLCDYIAERGQTPVTWKGASYDDYLRKMLLSVEANVDGKEQTSLAYTMNGTATTLGSVSGNAFAVEGSKEITADNGYEVYRSRGKYEALNFMERLATTDKYHYELAFNSGYSHMNAQEDFLYAGHDNGETKPIAMLIDGIWWENEARSTFNSMADSMGDEYAKENRNFALMPLPKASAEDAGKNTLLDSLYSLCFMKSNIEEWKKPLALDFIAFVNSDESLVEFTQITNTPKDLDYEMTEEQMSSMTTFGRSVMKLKSESDIVYPYSNSAIYVNQSSSFNADKVWETVVNGTSYTGPISAFVEKGVTAIEYFNGMMNAQKSKWGQKVY